MNNIIKTDETYNNWISSLKKKYRNSQIKAAMSVNREMLLFYWNLGRDITLMKAEILIVIASIICFIPLLL